MLYLKKYRLGIGLFFLFVLIFSVIFALYGLPLGAVFYPALVFFVLGGALVLLDIAAQKRRHRLLARIASLPAALMGDFPKPASLAEADYLRIVQALRQEQAETLDRANLRYQDMVDYYTTWVHQIKTPIASMHLLLQGEDSDFSRRVGEDLFRIEQYVEMVLAFLRLDAESTDYVLAPCDLDAVVRQAVRRFSSPFIRKGISLRYEPLRATALTDEKWLQFALEQVLSNALKYTPPGGTITVDLEAPLTLCVRDTGIGIASEDLPRVFEKGFTGYNGRTDKKASGIGLYLCRRILRALNHDIEINSAPGAGTVVRIRLQTRQGRLE